MTNKNLDMAIETWRFFVEAHPDADMEAVVKHIAEETRKLTLQEVGEWLERHDIASTTAVISIDPEIIEALQRGEMPE